MADPVLAAFEAAPDESAADHALAILLEEHALPLARRIATRKLRGHGAGGFRPEDIEDVVGDAMLVLVDRLREMRAGAARIECLSDYTAAVTFNVCAHHIRRRHPERARLKSRLRYLFTHRRSLSLWEDADSGAVCGLAAWRREAPRHAVREALLALADGGERPSFGAGTVDSVEGLAGAAEQVLRSVGGAVELDVLTRARARLCGLESWHPGATAEATAREGPVDEALDRRRAVERAWSQIAELPPRQREALLLSLRDAGGVSLLWVLPLLGVATVRGIARAMGWDAAALAEVWARLPLDDNAIALRLGCTRQQVINLRMSARKRLGNRRDAGPPARPETRANLGPSSPSLENEA